MKNKIIQRIEQAQLNPAIPEFRSGDSIEVKLWVVEGTKKRLQSFEGIVIAKRHRGLNSSFTLRKISNGEGVERVFQTHSPSIASVEVKRYGAAKRAKLYYLRQRTGKAARIQERLTRIPNKKLVVECSSQAGETVQ